MGAQMFEAEGRLNGFLMDPDKLVIVGSGMGNVLGDSRADAPLDEALVRSVMALGVREPVIVRKNQAGQPEVVDGRQRVRAAREANKRLDAAGVARRFVPVLAARGEEGEMFELMVALNHHVPESPLSRAQKLRQYVDWGHTKEQAKVAFCLPTISAVDQLLALLETPKRVQQAVVGGRMSVTAASKLVGMPGDKVDEVMEALSTEGPAPRSRTKLTVAQVEKAVKRSKGEAQLEPPRRAAVEALRRQLLKYKVPVSSDAMAVLFWVTTGKEVGCVADMHRALAAAMKALAT